MVKKSRQDELENEQLELEESSSRSGDESPIEKETISKEELKKAVFGNSNQSTKDFDWEEYEGGRNLSTGARKDMEDLYGNTLQDIKEKVVIFGTVVGMTDKDVVLNIGFKSDGLVPLSEFKYKPGLKVGDEVEIIVEDKEDKNGQIVISHKKAQAERAWELIIAAHENDTIVQGLIKDRTKGGMVVDLMGLDAFLPGSQLDVKPIKDYDVYVGQTMDLKVVKVNIQYRNIVVSHKAIIESGLELQKTEILSKLEKGQVLEGIVKNLTNFGVFVDLGGVDGLIHITDVSWGRINHPEEVLEVGQKINVVVLDYDGDKKRISLGMKQLTPHPWDTLAEDIKEGSTVTGKVVNIEDYGAFIELSPGVEGLVHVSEMSYSTHLKSPHEYVKLGEEIEAKVLNLDRDERKLSLGLKQLSNDPWSNIEEKYPVGSKHKAIVRSLTNFGLFVELEEGIDGLVHISDLSWTKKFGHPAEFTKTGEALDVIVLDLDKENRRLSLGHKQLEEDPWDTFESIFLEGSVHQGVVLSNEEKGAVIALPYGVEAFAPKKFLQKADKSKMKVDETLDFKVIEFDKGNKKIILSHSDIWRDEERSKYAEEDKQHRVQEENTKKDVKKVKDKVEKSTLADELDILSQLKTKMEAKDKEKQEEAMAMMAAKESTKGSKADTAEVESPEGPDAGTSDNEEEAPKPSKAPKKSKAVEAETAPDADARAENAEHVSEVVTDSPAEEAPAKPAKAKKAKASDGDVTETTDEVATEAKPKKKKKTSDDEATDSSNEDSSNDEAPSAE
jgi:small subunit ribosomal protein S1